MPKRNKVLALILCSMAMPIYAAKADRENPMHIEASNARLDQKTQVSVFTGNVIIVQGTMQLLASKVMVREDAEGNQYSEGSGAPVRFRQKIDNSPDYLEAQALRFDYNGKTGILKLYDKAWVKRGVDDVKGDVITYDMNQETYEAQTQQAGRVNVTITPKKKSAPQTDKNAEKTGKPAGRDKLPGVFTEHTGQ